MSGVPLQVFHKRRGTASTPCTSGRNSIQQRVSNCCSGSIERASTRTSSTPGATQVAPARSASSNGSVAASVCARSAVQAGPMAHSTPNAG